MKVNILLLTINRYDITLDCVGDALRNAGHEFGLCVTDNGSKDQRVIDLIESWNPIYFKKNGTNKGTAQSLNEMINNNPADLWVFIGNDIRLPKDWLKMFVESAANFNSGVIGLNWRPVQYSTKEVNGIKIWQTDRVFGTMGITKELRETLGQFCEEYGVYGLWDGEYSLRAEIAGKENYYIHNQVSYHEAHDVGEETEYRKMKDDSLSAAKNIFAKNVFKYIETKKVKI